MLSRDRPIVIIADPGREHEAAIRLGRIGFDHIVGYLKDGLRSLESRPDLTATTERVSAPLAAERLARRRAAGGRRPHAGRARAEARRRQRQHPAESPRRAPPGTADDRPLLVYCAGGYRSSIAASLLQQRGFTRVSEIAGGLAAWEAAKLPVETSAQPENRACPSAMLCYLSTFRHKSMGEVPLARLWQLPDGTPCLLSRIRAPRTGSCASSAATRRCDRSISAARSWRWTKPRSGARRTITRRTVTLTRRGSTRIAATDVARGARGARTEDPT